MSRRQFLQDMRRDTRMRSAEYYQSDSSSACTQNTSFTSQDLGHTIEKPYQTCEGLIDPTDTYTGAGNTDRITVCAPTSMSTDLQGTLAVPRCDYISLRLPSSGIDNPHESRRSSNPEEVVSVGERLVRNFGSHNPKSLTGVIDPILAPRCGEAEDRSESCLDSSTLRRAELGSGSVTSGGLQERLAHSGVVQNITDVKLRDENELKVAFIASAVSLDRAFSEATRTIPNPACGIASLQAKSSTTLRDTTPGSFTRFDSSSSTQKNDKNFSNSGPKESGLRVEFNGNPLNSLASSGNFVKPSQSRMMDSLGTNTACKDQFSNASHIEASLLSLQVELANEKKRNIEAERLISSLNHEIETLRADNLKLSATMASATGASCDPRQDVAADAAARGRVPAAYIVELEQRISKVTTVLEAKQSEIEAKDERIRLLEHTLANRLLSTVVTPAVTTAIGAPLQNAVHTGTRGEVRAANIPDILSRTQAPVSAAVVHAKASSLHDYSTFTEESRNSNKLCNSVVSNHAGVEQSVGSPQIPAQNRNLGVKPSERMPHLTIDATRNTPKTISQSMKVVEISSSRDKLNDEGHIDSNKNQSDDITIKHQPTALPRSHSTVVSQRSESVRRAEALSVQGQEDAQLRLFSKQVRHSSVDPNNWRSRNSDGVSARASPRKPSVRRTLRKVSTASLDTLPGSSTAVDSAHRSPVPGPRSATATRSSFSHPYRMSVTAAPPLIASTTKTTAEHPPAGISRQSSKPLCSMMRAWGRRGGKSPSPRGSPSLRSATSVNSRPRILFIEKDETTVMQGKTTTAVFRSSRTRQPTPLANDMVKLREPPVRDVDRASLIPPIEVEGTGTRGSMNN